ncbi:MAG: hypothetical protein HY900_20755 [Deltaproteobacteria bacterium]|nr:hypothetical protein [Deltaproteobacteria bacterium]
MRNPSSKALIVLLAVLPLASCGGGGGGGTPLPAVDTVAVQGTVAPPAARLGAQAAAPGLPQQVGVELVNEAGTTAADDVVAPATDPAFALTVPAGHEYVMVFRDAQTGRTLGVLEATATPGGGFSLPAGAADVNLGTVAVDPRTGTATCPAAATLPEPGAGAAIEDDADDDGVPDVADDSTDEDDDGTLDIDDDFAFESAASADTDSDGMPDAFNPDATPQEIEDSGLVTDDDDDGDGHVDVDTDGDELGDSVDPDDDNDDLPDDQDPDDDNDGTPDDQEPPPAP